MRTLKKELNSGRTWFWRSEAATRNAQFASSKIACFYTLPVLERDLSVSNGTFVKMLAIMLAKAKCGLHPTIHGLRVAKDFEVVSTSKNHKCDVRIKDIPRDSLASSLSAGERESLQPCTKSNHSASLNLWVVD